MWIVWKSNEALAPVYEEISRHAIHTVKAPDVAKVLENNRARMDYARYRAKGWFIGSGMVEAGCKGIVGQRLKNSGMQWQRPARARC